MFTANIIKLSAVLTIGLLLASCSRNTIYIVRHAEKVTANANMSSDVPLSTEGSQRAQNLKTLLQGHDFAAIYSTPYIRTKTTAQPLSEAKQLPVQLYSPKDTTDKFICFCEIKTQSLPMCTNTVSAFLSGTMNSTVH